VCVHRYIIIIRSQVYICVCMCVSVLCISVIGTERRWYLFVCVGAVLMCEWVCVLCI